MKSLMQRQFEEWAKSEGIDTDQFLNEFDCIEYVYYRTKELWKAWQASRQTAHVLMPQVCGDEMSGQYFDEVTAVLDSLGITWKEAL